MEARVFGVISPEKQNDQSDKTGGNSHIHIAQNLYGEGSYQGSGSRIDNVVSDQDGTEHFSGIRNYFFQNCSALVSLPQEPEYGCG